METGIGFELMNLLCVYSYCATDDMRKLHNVSAWYGYAQASARRSSAGLDLTISSRMINFIFLGSIVLKGGGRVKKILLENDVHDRWYGEGWVAVLDQASSGSALYTCVSLWLRNTAPSIIIIIATVLIFFFLLLCIHHCLVEAQIPQRRELRC
jgi:hypothetical protein